MADPQMVTIYHADLDRHDQVTVEAAAALARGGWDIVDDLPTEPPAVPLDADPDTPVDLEHPQLGRTCTVPAGAARALVANGGWHLATDTGPLDPDQAAADEQALLVELSGLTPEQLAHLTDPADTGDPTTPDTED
jgi:hypothetical protein